MEFTSVISSYGTGAVIVVLLSILIMTLRENRKLLESFKEKDEKHDEQIKDLDEKVCYIHDNYMTKQDCFREMEGWRTEMGEIKAMLNKMDGRLYEIVRNKENG